MSKLYIYSRELEFFKDLIVDCFSLDESVYIHQVFNEDGEVAYDEIYGKISAVSTIKDNKFQFCIGNWTITVLEKDEE